MSHESTAPSMAPELVRAMRDAGFDFFVGVPCSLLKGLVSALEADESLHYVSATREDSALGMAFGARLAGKLPMVLMQNSGLGNAVSPLTSLNAIFKIPTLMIVTLRGEPGGPKDEPQHELMGQITIKMLETMNVGWEYFPQEESKIAGAIERAVGHMGKTELPFCFVMKKDSVAPYKLSLIHI